MLAIKQVFDLSSNDSFLLYFDQFLDDFKRASREEKVQAVKDEPVMYDRFAKNKYCIVAAAVEMLANQYDFPAPEWVFAENYKMKRPYYEFNTTIKAYQALLRDVTPIEFRHRNLYVYPNVIDRV